MAPNDGRNCTTRWRKERSEKPRRRRELSIAQIGMRTKPQQKRRNAHTEY